MRESHLAKAGTKLPNSGPPTTPMEKYKLRVAIGKLTGRLDLACKAVWPAEDASTHTHSTATAVQIAGTASEPSSAEAAGDGGDAAIFLTQDSEAEPSNPGEEESLEGIFDQVADSRIGSTAEEEAALEEGDGSEDPAAANPKKKAKEMVLDFRLSVLPKEIMRISGILTSSTASIICCTHWYIRVLLVVIELTELWLCNNVISVLPDSIGQLQQLTTLSLTNNKLDSLCPGLCQLVNLRRLYVRGNGLTSLPNLMGQLLSLQHIDCGKNKLHAFPEVLTSMPRLVHLDFSSNYIPTLPPTLEALQNLVHLNLLDNRIPKPQPVLLRMPWVQVLGVPLSAENRGAQQYTASLSEEHELMNMLKSRAAASLTAKLRRKKKKSSYL